MTGVISPIRFGAFEVDFESGELRKGGIRIHISDQPLQILRLLLEHSGEVVTRDDLHKRLWSDDTFVDFDHGLNAAVKRLREALGDSAEHPRYIETIPRHGYRFIGTPTPVVETATTSQPRNRRKYVVLGLTAVACVAIAVVAARTIIHRASDAATKSTIHSIAVLPFVDMSPGKDQQYFSDGLADELLTALAKLPELRVIARTSSFQFKGKDEDLRVVGQKLNVQSILEGGVRKEGTRVRITVQLINAADGFHLWSESYDRELNDIFAVQEDIGKSVAESLKISLLRSSAAKSPEHSKNIEAYKAFLQGRYFSERRGRADMERSVGYFEKALQLNPDDARAWAGLADARTHQADSGYISVEEGYGKAREAVQRALALDANLAKAHQVMAWIKMAHDWDWAGADASFQRALTLEPGDATTIWEAGRFTGFMGRFPEALALNRKSVEMDPLSPTVYLNLGNLSYYMGRQDEASVALLKALELNPEYPVARAYLCRVYLMQSRAQDALKVADGETDPGWRLYGLALANKAVGRSAESDKILAEFIAKHGGEFAYQIAQVYAYRGEADKAFEWLDKAYAQRDPGLTEITGDPMLKSIVHDPRYAAIVKKAGLPM